ncbi:Vacuolar protein sorting-associated protein [Wickerhamomyces ciferrii]|uniref:Vacuolar protein sorting-associated protein n=1 Tax=Wickerhamomyces ciferrii (strain ATCC 14091 / BCRC 22168 / CBS 111 / JCM 3599 / NBRC 0793 / NRRL Y-1031 F-60-10) TaxID=1206466 RepID=K0KTU9_WICCF|nr:Vacuolar protein sorting-associated protein [Wickerhamomyces ciferrii]CCH44804.1 Vacuolar protein sorting-associated protein [Wickerhamomyces ciferrii]
MSDPLDQLISILSKQQKTLVIEKSLSTYINSLIPFSNLKSKTNILDVYWFEKNSIKTILESTSQNITFLIKSNLSNLELLQEFIHDLINFNPSYKIDLILTQDYFKSFKIKLSQHGLIGDLNSINSWLIYIQQDSTIQLYLDELNSLYLYKNSNIPFKLAQWVHNYLLKNPEIRITHILAKGLNSSKFVSIWKNLNNNYISSLSPLDKKQYLKIDQGLYGSNTNNSGKQCDLIVLERNLDFLSVLLNQLTYSGIIDELYDIDINSIKLDDEFFNLNEEEDSLYDSIKFKNFGEACDELNTQAKELQSNYNDLQSQSTISQVKQFVDNLPHLESLKKQVSNHTKLSESILTQLETNDEFSKFNILLEFQQDIILQNLTYSSIISKILELIYEDNYSFEELIRLISITSIIYNGIREKDYIQLNNEILEFFGFQNFQILQNLIKIGLITIRGDPSIIKNFNNLNLKLNLVPNDDDPLGFAYRGYIPLITRILEQTISTTKRSSWDHLDLKSLILGKTIDEELTQDNIGLGGLLQKNSIVIIVMIGGLTYSELATIKKLEKLIKEKTGVEKKFIVVTDSFINAKKLINSNK